MFQACNIVWQILQFISREHQFLQFSPNSNTTVTDTQDRKMSAENFHTNNGNPNHTNTFPLCTCILQLIMVEQRLKHVCDFMLLLFQVIEQQVLVISYQLIRTTYRSDLGPRVKIILTGSPETSVRNYQYLLCHNAEERCSHLLHGRNLKSHEILCAYLLLSVHWNRVPGLHLIQSFPTKNLEVLGRVQENPPLVPILSQMNPFHSFCFFQICFNIFQSVFTITLHLKLENI